MGPKLASGVSGLAWGLFGFWLFSDTNLKESAWVGLLVSPAIGLSIGALTVRSKPRSELGGFVLGLVNLYLAVALFAAAIALGHMAWEWGEMPTLESRGRGWVLVEIVGNTLLGLTFTGWVLLLAPLSWANHRLIWHLRDERRPGAPLPSPSGEHA
jgi:hypothetical protein